MDEESRWRGRGRPRGLHLADLVGQFHHRSTGLALADPAGIRALLVKHVSTKDESVATPIVTAPQTETIWDKRGAPLGE